MDLLLIVVILIQVSTTVADVNFTLCLDKFKSGAFGLEGGTDNYGRPVSDLSLATGLTYEACTRVCGTGQLPFQWDLFSQQFNSWLLPHLALISQLPYGANDRLQNLESMLLTVGSPMLAIYSLTLTALNNRWISRRFSRYHHSNARNVAHSLTGLQQSPIKVTIDKLALTALVILPQNTKYWHELSTRLNYNHTWTISATATITCAVIAYILTVIDSFNTPANRNPLAALGTLGQGIGFLWIWLLPVVTCWLLISPKCDSIQNSRAVDYANRYAYIIGEDGIPILRSSVLHNSAMSLQNFGDDFQLRKDEECTVPIFNYARVFSWVQVVEEIAQIFDVDSKGAKTIQFNTQGNISHASASEGLSVSNGVVRTKQRIWDYDLLSRLIVATMIALCLQWGTTGAGVITIWFTPVVGLGCRSLSCVLYGALSMLVWMLLVFSSISSHYVVAKARQHHSRLQTLPNNKNHVLRTFSILSRRIGKVLAVLNCMWLLICSIFQFSNVYNRCMCTSNALTSVNRSYYLIDFSSEDFAPMKSTLLGGAILAACVVGFFIGFINLLIHPPLLQRS